MMAVHRNEFAAASYPSKPTSWANLALVILAFLALCGCSEPQVPPKQVSTKVVSQAEMDAAMKLEREITVDTCLEMVTLNYPIPGDDYVSGFGYMGGGRDGFPRCPESRSAGYRYYWEPMLGKQVYQHCLKCRGWGTLTDDQDHIKARLGNPDHTQMFQSEGGYSEIWYYGQWQIVFGPDTSINRY